MTDFISLDVESLNTGPFDIVALAAHFYSNNTLTESILLKRPVQQSKNTWFNQNVLPQIQGFKNNCKDAGEIYSRFLDFYIEKSSPKKLLGLITYCSCPYEEFVINYLKN